MLVSDGAGEKGIERSRDSGRYKLENKRMLAFNDPVRENRDGLARLLLGLRLRRPR